MLRVAAGSTKSIIEGEVYPFPDQVEGLGSDIVDPTLAQLLYCDDCKPGGAGAVKVVGVWQGATYPHLDGSAGIDQPLLDRPDDGGGVAGAWSTAGAGVEGDAEDGDVHSLQRLGVGQSKVYSEIRPGAEGHSAHITPE
jgi:hypothetical protein